MASIPYDWEFNANRSGVIIPGLVSADTNGNVTIVGKISVDNGTIYSNGSGVLSAVSFSGDITNTTVSYTDSSNNTITTGAGIILKTMIPLMSNIDSDGIYIGELGADNKQINSDGNGKISVNDIDIGNQESTSLEETYVTYSDTVSGSTTISIRTELDINSDYTYYASGTGIPSNSEVTASTKETDATTSTNYWNITISVATTADIPVNSNITISRINNSSTINFYTSGNTTPCSKITISGTSGSTESTTTYDMDTVVMTTNSLTFDGSVILMPKLPTTDPKVANQLWINGGVLMVSQG